MEKIIHNVVQELNFVKMKKEVGYIITLTIKQSYLHYKFIYQIQISTSFNNSTTGAKKNSGWFFANTGTELHGLKPLLNDRS